MKEWVWLDASVLLAAHDEQIAEHGGGAGMRDSGLFESALGRARNLAAYGDPDAAALAASYAFGLAKNHAFVDGNKRIAFVAMELFLDLNGFVLTADDAQCVIVMLSLASSAFSEDELAEWIRKNAKGV
ncbi:MAG TPA: type II toxin-antitoxin system death-on-curing family toxin [Rhizomicrobium sp.]|jgi:death-on-curing protein|nr:type II toxin-antitoxin system death-on-curing family toxin [Rhizomicrobium sp.]